MIPGEIFTGLAEFQGIVSVNDFKLPIGLEELLLASLSSCEDFVLHGYHRAQNDNKCKSLINSKTISVRKNTEIIFQNLLLPKNLMSA